MYLDNWFLGVQRQSTERRGSGLHRLARTERLPPAGHQPLQRRPVRRRLKRDPSGLLAIIYTEATDESTFQGGTLAIRANRADVQAGRGVHVRPGARLLELVLGGVPARCLRPVQSGRRPGGLRCSAAAVGLGQLDAAVAGVGCRTGAPRRMAGGGRDDCAERCALHRRLRRSCIHSHPGRRRQHHRQQRLRLQRRRPTPDRPDVPSFGDSRDGLSNDDFLSGIFVASDFPTPAPGVPGNLGRNTFRGPRYFNVDISFAKRIRIPWTIAGSTGADFQIRLEMFNAFNTTNLNNPVNNMTSPLFGRSTSALPGRIIQFGGRFAF